MICTQLDVDHTTFINENIEYLLSMWLIKNYQLAKFPWFLAPCCSQNDFFNDHIETLTICILRHKSDILKDFVPLIAGESMASIIDVTYIKLIVLNIDIKRYALTASHRLLSSLHNAPVGQVFEYARKLFV